MAENVIQLNEGNFDEAITSSTKPVLVDFWAPWCGPCRMVSPVIDELADEYEGKLTVAKVNVDECNAIAMRYRVMSIPTVIIFKAGEVAERAVGAKSKQGFKQMIDQNL